MFNRPGIETEDDTKQTKKCRMHFNVMLMCAYVSGCIGIGQM